MVVGRVVVVERVVAARLCPGDGALYPIGYSARQSQTHQEDGETKCRDASDLSCSAQIQNYPNNLDYQVYPAARVFCAK